MHERAYLVDEAARRGVEDDVSVPLECRESDDADEYALE